MARFAICWELGGRLGHVVRLGEIAAQLAARGHECVFVVRDPGAVLGRLGARRYRVLAAPAVAFAQRSRPDVGWADVLWNDCGFHDAAQLRGVWCAWHDLLERIDADALLVDGAPVALGAAASLGVPRIETTNAFFVPPRAPWPSFRRWEKHSAAHLPERERQILERANAARGLVGDAAAATLGEAFASDVRLVFTVPELDLYAPREDVEYVGPVAGAADGEPPRWPDGAGPRVFVYVGSDYAHRERLHGALARATDARVVYYCDGDAPALPPHVAVHTRPVDTRAALADAAAVVCHGGGLAATALLAGVPVLNLPTQPEQQNTALALTALGAGLHVTPPYDKPDFLQPLRRVVGEAGFRASAQAIAARYTGRLDPATTAERVAAACEQLAGTPRRAAATA